MECQTVCKPHYHHHQQQTHTAALSNMGILSQHQQQQGEAGEPERAEVRSRAVLRAGPEGCTVLRAVPEGCTVLDVEMEVQEGGRAAGPCSSAASTSSREQGEEGGGGGGGGEGDRLASEAAAPGGNSAQLPFSRELITLSLFGKMPRRGWKHGLNSRIAEVQQAFKNIPQMLYFSPSSVSLHGIGVYAAESLPKDTLLGPYLGKPIRKEQVDAETNNQWLWEVYEDDGLAYFIDARDPKYGNWMNFIQCARSSLEQNLRMAQYNNHLYFVVTLDIQVGEELLVWYDQEQYDTYMGLPTGFKELPPPPLFQDHQQQTVPQGTTGHTSPSAPPPLQEHLTTPSYASFCGHTSSGGGSFSDSASTDDSGVCMETNGGPTPPTFDPSVSHPNPPAMQRDGSTLPPEEACTAPPEGTYHTPTVPGASSPHLLPGLISGGPTATPSSSSETGGFVFAGARLGAESTVEQLQQWYPPLTGTIATTAVDKPASTPPDNSPAHTPSENHTSWVGPTRPYVESPTSLAGVALLPGGGSTGGAGGPGGKKHLLYGLFSRTEDGTRWHCEECKRLFSSQGSLRAHARIHTGERPYQCRYCFRSFCQASTLRSHERLHTGEKPYKCEDCGRAFTQSAGLRSHRKTHRYDT